MESNTISKREQCSEHPGLKHKAKLPNQKLPYELLLILFSYLPIPDLISLQWVCSGWRAAAQDKSLWKKFTLYVHGTAGDIKKLKTMPGLRNITGEAENHFVYAIMENVMELSQLNCKFSPPLSFSQIKRIFEKYTELDSITLDMSAADIMDSLNFLRTSKYLKIVNIISSNGQILTAKHGLSVLLNIYTIFTDGDNFPALTNIDIADCSYRVRTSTFMKVVSEAISKRSLQLLSLKVTVEDIETVKLINAINMCTKLHALHIQVYEKKPFKDPVCLNIDRMSQLKSLYMDISNSSSFLPMLHNSLYKGSWIHLRELNLYVSRCDQLQMNILKSVLENMKQLRKLTYYDFTGTTIEKELKDIGSLLHLEELEVYSLSRLSPKGMNYLSQCRNLKGLLLYACESSECYNLNVAIMMNSMKKLEHLSVDVDGKYCGYFSGRDKIEEFIERFAHLFPDNTLA